MSLIDDLTTWLYANPPDAIPYWPGAAVTSPFGLRRTQKELDAGASPAHLGTDRSRKNGHYKAPFDGRLSWRPVDGVAGSLLAMRPHDLLMEIQVFHTRAGAHTSEIDEAIFRGQDLPVRPSNLGLSVPVGSGDGTHTHTEVLLPHDDALEKWLGCNARIITDGVIDGGAVLDHCNECGLDFAQVMDGLHDQVAAPPLGWGLVTLTDRYAVRESVPDYRLPHWGRGATIHVDSMWLLQI